MAGGAMVCYMYELFLFSDSNVWTNVTISVVIRGAN